MNKEFYVEDKDIVITSNENGRIDKRLLNNTDNAEEILRLENKVEIVKKEIFNLENNISTYKKWIKSARRLPKICFVAVLGLTSAIFFPISFTTETVELFEAIVYVLGFTGVTSLLTKLEVNNQINTYRSDIKNTYTRLNRGNQKLEEYKEEISNLKKLNKIDDHEPLLYGYVYSLEKEYMEDKSVIHDEIYIGNTYSKRKKK